MSCICQYFVPSKHPNIKGCSVADNLNTERKAIEDNAVDNELQSSQCEVSATDLAAARAEIWILAKNLSEAQISIENLENLLKTIIDKQSTMLTEMYNLKRMNFELQEECRMQRDYHTMERNAMIRELHDIKALLSNRSKLLEETVQKNTQLTNAVQDANEKIYMMGIKFLKLKSSHSRQSSKPNSSRSSDQEQSE